MTSESNRKVVLASRPVGEPTQADFSLETETIPAIGDGEILCKTKYLSLDPYMRGRMSDAKSYSAPVGIGEVIVGGTVSEVIASNNDKFKPGDTVFSMGGWQEYSVSDGSDAVKIDPSAAPISTALGILGMPGMTAYTGLMNIGQPKEGETVVVAAASGAVGSAVGQIAKLKGCRAVGIAGSPEKCRYVVEELGFDACVSHRDEDFPAQLAAACPDGIDVYFENVGGKVFTAVSKLLNWFARIPVCGLIANYNLTELPEGPDMTALLQRQILTHRLTLRGFIVWDFADQQKEFVTAMSGWLKEGKIKYKEDIVEGLENAPEAFIGLLNGKNFGKLVIHVSD